jgi:hypothetical protein
MVASMKMIAFWDIAPCGLIEVDSHFRGVIALMMEAVRTTEMSVYFLETTWLYIPECHLPTAFITWHQKIVALFVMPCGRLFYMLNA